MTTKLKELRNENFQIYQNIISLIQKRRTLVKQIVIIKELNKLDLSYDPHFENELFQSLKEALKDFSYKELLALSLLIEDHIGQSYHYPQWSDKIHLKVINAQKYDLINPLLLKAVYPNEFSSLKFSKDFLFLEEFKK